MRVVRLPPEAAALAFPAFFSPFFEAFGGMMSSLYEYGCGASCMLPVLGTLRGVGGHLVLVRESGVEGVAEGVGGEGGGGEGGAGPPSPPSSA